MERIHTFCIAVLLLAQSALACSWTTLPFCATSNVRPDDVVLSGRVVGVDMDGIDVEVIHVLKGSENRDTIRIWDGTDFDCNGLFSMAAADLGSWNDTIIVVLPWIDGIENAWDVIGDYRRPVFYNYGVDDWGFTPSLLVVNGNAQGYVHGVEGSPVMSMPYVDLMANWNDGPNHCSIFLSVAGASLTAPFAAHLVHTTLNLTIRDDVAMGSTIRLYAAGGQEVVAVKGTGSTMRLDLSGLATGMYSIVLVQQDGSRSSTRVLKS